MTTEPGEVWRTLAKLIQAKTNVVAKPGMPLLRLNIDSLMMAELTVELEKQFGIRVDESVLDVETIDDLASYVESRMETGKRP